MKFTLDRFEENYAILENRQNGEMIEIPKEMIQSDAKEGDILELIDGKYVVSIYETNQQKEHIKFLMERLRKKED